MVAQNEKSENWLAEYGRKLDEMVGQDRLSAYTARNYKGSATQFFSEFGFPDKNSIRKFLAKADSKSINSTVRMLRNLVSTLELKGVLEGINFPVVKLNSQPTQPFSENEYCLIREFIELKKNYRQAFNFDFLMATGIRAGELNDLAQEQNWRNRLEFVDDYHAFVTVKQKRNRALQQPVFRRVPILDYELVQTLRRLNGLSTSAKFPIPIESLGELNGFLTLTQWMGSRQGYEIPKSKNPFFSLGSLRNFTKMVNREFQQLFHPHRTRATVISLLVAKGHRHPMVCRYADFDLPDAYPTFEQLVIKKNPRISEAKFSARLDRTCFRMWVGHISKSSLAIHKRYVNEEVLALWQLN